MNTLAERGLVSSQLSEAELLRAGPRLCGRAAGRCFGGGTAVDRVVLLPITSSILEPNSSGSGSALSERPGRDPPETAVARSRLHLAAA